MNGDDDEYPYVTLLFTILYLKLFDYLISVML